MKERLLRAFCIFLVMSLLLPGSLFAFKFNLKNLFGSHQSISVKLNEFSQTTFDTIQDPILKFFYVVATKGIIDEVRLGEQKESVVDHMGCPTFEKNKKDLTVLFYADKGMTFGFKKKKLIHISFWNFYNGKEINLNFSDIEAILGGSPKHQYSNKERRIRFFGKPLVEGFVLGYLPKKEMEKNNEKIIEIFTPALMEWRRQQQYQQVLQYSYRDLLKSIRFEGTL